MNRTEEVVFLMIKYSVIDRYTRCNEFRNATLNQLLCCFRILQLIANSNPFARSHQFRQISIKSMMRKSCQFHKLRSAISPSGKCYSQYFRCNDCIIRKSLIKIAHTKQQYCIGMLFLNLDKLPHHRGLCYFFCHKLLFIINQKYKKYSTRKKYIFLLHRYNFAQILVLSRS